jgi:hypothetical protein
MDVGVGRASATAQIMKERQPAMIQSASSRRTTLLACLALLASAILAGCGGGVSPTGGDADFQTRRRMSMVASFYGDFLSANGVPPKDEAAFRAFLEERSVILKRMNLDVNELLTSPRDGQPLVIVYGKKLAPADSPGTPWATIEQTGVDGKRMAAQVRGAVDELSPEAVEKEFGSLAKK